MSCLESFTHGLDVKSKELWGVRSFKTIGWIDQSSLTGGPIFHRRISCRVCQRSFDVMNMGEGAVKSHGAGGGAKQILIVLLRILNCCVDPVPVRNDYFGGGVCMSVYYDLFHMTGCVSLF